VNIASPRNAPRARHALRYASCVASAASSGSRRIRRHSEYTSRWVASTSSAHAASSPFLQRSTSSDETSSRGASLPPLLGRLTTEKVTGRDRRDERARLPGPVTVEGKQKSGGWLAGVEDSFELAQHLCLVKQMDSLCGELRLRAGKHGYNGLG